MDKPDPFRHHPRLRPLVTDPDMSALRDLTLANLADIAAAHDLPTGWWYSDAEREAIRRREMAGHTGGDLWVFAYGSLMWDPGIHFTELRRAYLPDYERKFILKDIYGGRGTAEAPGLMAALDRGVGCHGIAFRISADLVEAETRALWRRERIGPCYFARFLPARMADADRTILTFVADHDATLIAADLTRDEQIRYLATGSGFLGTSLDYIRKVEAKFHALGIADDDVTALRQDAEAYLAAQTAPR